MTNRACGALLVAIAAASANAQVTGAAAPSGIVTPYGHDPRASVAAGELTQYTLFDSAYKRNRRVWVYTPPGYSAAAHPAYDVIIAFDGDEYREAIPLPMILDTLAAGRHSPPFVAVLVDDSTGTVRLGDLANRAPLVEFFARQLVPWLRNGWNVTRDPGRTIVTGSSAGGLAAAYVALARPDLFGNVLAQSGAFWRGNEASNAAPFEWLTTRVAALPRRDIRFFVDMGGLETAAVLRGHGPVPIDAARRFRDALVAKGYRVDYTEVPGAGHAPQYWQARLPAGIVALTSQWAHDSTTAPVNH